MQFVHEKWILLYKKIKQACSDYKVTVMTIELFTLYAVIGGLWSDLDLEYESPITKFLFSDMVLIFFLLLFMISSMLVESIFSYGNKQRKIMLARIAGFAISALIDVILVWGIYAGNKAQEAELIFHLSGDVVEEWCGRFTVGYVLLTVVAIVYVCHRKSRVGFIEYVLHVGVYGDVFCASHWFEFYCFYCTCAVFRGIFYARYLCCDFVDRYLLCAVMYHGNESYEQ